MNRRVKRVVLIVAILAVLSVFHADASDLSLVGTFGGAFNDIKVQGNYAYVAMEHGIQIFDVSISSSPQLVAFYKTSNAVIGIIVAGGTAYTQVDDRGLLILDVSDPAQPSLLSSYDTDSSLNFAVSNFDGFFVSDDKVYIHRHAHGMLIFDVSSPSSPVLLGEFESSLAGYNSNYFVSGTTAYIAGYNKLVIIDISDPSSPSLLGSYGDKVVDVFVSSTTAYIVDSEGFKILDVSDPSSPVVIGETSGNYTGILISGTTAFVSGTSGLTLIDVSILSSPSIISTYGGSFRGMDSSANKLYVISSSSPGFEIIDISDTSNLTMLGSSENIGTVKDIVISGTIAYLANGGLGIFDVSDQSSPAFLGQYYTGGDTQEVFIEGNTAFIADFDKGLVIIDVTNPISPTLLSSYAIEEATRVTVSGNLAYVGKSGGKIKIIDVSKPASPKLLGKTRKFSRPSKIFVSGKTLFVSQRYLYTIDIEKPKSPSLIKKLGYLGGDENYLDSIFIAGKTAYFGSEGSFLIYDISNPESPERFPNILSNPGSDEETVGIIYVSGNKAYAAVFGWFDTHTGIAVIDVSNRSNPKLLDIYDDKDAAFSSSIFASNNFVYLASGKNGLTILEDSSVASDIVPPVVSSINKKHAGYGDKITIKGDGFGESPGNVYFGSYHYKGVIISWKNNQIKVTVPWGLRSGRKGYKTAVYVEDAKGIWAETWKKFKFKKPTKKPKIKDISSQRIKTGDEITITAGHVGPAKYGVITKGADGFITSWDGKSVTIKITSVTANKVKIRVTTKYSKSNWKKISGIKDSK
ncbi:MAG: hypothetical protein D6734_05670 [Candidatus Schekmanbacteria bacterium]|nr:MAG: hypothetical protein D6734_05670 [Candidatus Schekmanbacteria bacterium]